MELKLGPPHGSGSGILLALGSAIAVLAIVRQGPLALRGLGLVVLLMGVRYLYVAGRHALGKGGILRVDAESALLPPASHLAAPAPTPRAALKFAYFLESRGLVVIETSERAFHYPAHCFVSRSDVRRLLAAVNEPAGATRPAA